MTANCNWWEYSRWTWIIGRTLRFNKPQSAPVRTAVEAFITALETTRPWLKPKLRRVSNQPTAGGDPLLINQPDNSDARMVMAIGRDLKKIPLTSIEEGHVDTLIAATGDRRYGDLGNLI